MNKRDERKQTFDEASRIGYQLSKPRYLAVIGKSVVITCLLATWQPLLKRHDFYSGLFVEHGNSPVDAKRKAQV